MSLCAFIVGLLLSEKDDLVIDILLQVLRNLYAGGGVLSQQVDVLFKSPFSKGIIETLAQMRFESYRWINHQVVSELLHVATDQTGVLSLPSFLFLMLLSEEKALTSGLLERLVCDEILQQKYPNVQDAYYRMFELEHFIAA